MSTAVHRCADGVGHLPVLQPEGGGYREVSTLPFATDCAGFQRLRFEHIATGDVDGDGRLDLYVTGYGGPWSKAADFNAYRAEDGLPDRLFLNRGGLAFVEEAAARGLVDAHYGYAAELVDLDGDGDRDVYVVDDYGPNDLWLNDGGGRFAAAPPGPLTAHGNSMGLSVADVDADGALDLYVSNMYSSAGNRIVPLVAGRVAPETHASLQAMVAGNALFVRDGASWRDAAAERGVRNALWAWGHAHLDVDGDARQDLGAVVRVTAAGRTQVVRIGLTAGLATQVARDARLGLGGATAYDLEVVWPDGRVQAVAGVPAGSVRVGPTGAVPVERPRWPEAARPRPVPLLADDRTVAGLDGGTVPLRQPGALTGPPERVQALADEFRRRFPELVQSSPPR